MGCMLANHVCSVYYLEVTQAYTIDIRFTSGFYYCLPCLPNQNMMNKVIQSCNIKIDDCPIHNLDFIFFVFDWS